MRKPLRALYLLAGFAVSVVFTACGDESEPRASDGRLRVETVATGLEAPWALAIAPDGRMFVTERPGHLRVLRPDGGLQREPLAQIDDVAAEGEGGLLGLALDPDFDRNGRLYLYYTYRGESGLQNRVVRYTERQGRLSEDAVLLDGIPGEVIHDGGRIAFGPDGKLYVTTGDAAQPELAQDRSSLGGKILRINPDGSVPADNPFPGSAVYSFGHRNPQGLAWNPETEDLYATEHGASGNDELNLIEPGANYGWPVVEGENHGQFAAPLAVYESSIAPSGAAWYGEDAIPPWRDDVLFATLVGTHLHRVGVDAGDPRGITGQEQEFEDRFGRLRDVQVGPDGELYLLTSNRDGRGSPTEDDDRLLRVSWRNG
ncbi:MAG TPA: PQQ-dependent sugar dehydrogenase [Gaiellaceae bacterium]|nr:PQQ-dependent sugar dehydrogenase [Gaiellaceae bacterium]